MKRKKKASGPTSDIHVRLTADLAVWAKTAAEQEERSLSGLIRRLIREEMARRGGIK